MFSAFKKKKAGTTEQRRAARHAWYHQTFFNQDGTDETDIEGCDIHDLSESGIRFHCGREIRPGSRVTVLIRLGSRILRLKAEVMWHRHFAEHKHGARLIEPGAGWPALLGQLVRDA